ncbi:M20 family metallo-hydrolase [Saccharopolyspora erythraea]|uniref:M20 family metallo-hydrolase n=1 Tax=Saccharopolyspora erythraea TaxID=1836 RepID=UPI001BAD8E86|nr:M20 family metallo-hydrolase [Saccharopolyspora erythraea]QUH04041.1 M20 family metallo-hydrolase [Saccharopolyspora erythraea]
MGIDSEQAAVDDEAFLADFAALSAIGATESGGVERQAATDADRATKVWLGDWLRQRGFEVRVDAIGNLFGLLEWTPGAPYILMGSHLDSQPCAGRFDGAYGVLAAAHAAVRLRDRIAGSPEPPPFNVAVVNWFNEEGSRFQPSMMGSGVFTGKLDLAEALSTPDSDGVSVQQALEEIGFAGTGQMPEIAGYAEIHVEQGRELEAEGVTIGLVESNWAAHKYRVVVRGEQAHTGSTAMEERRDALLGAARLVVAARELIDHAPPRRLHTSVGQLTVTPNSPVVVAREVKLHLDLRSPDQEVLEEADRRLRAEFARIEREAQVEIEVAKAHFWEIEPYQPAGVSMAEAIAGELGLSRRRMLTLAGHDSTNMKDIVPTVMLFVPSAQGIAHNEFEYTSDADLLAGVTMLTEVASRMCRGDLKN